MFRPRFLLFLFLILCLPALRADERQEALVTWITGQFHRLDVNGDGKLTPDEFGKFPWLKRLDLNQDGAVTLEEATKGLTQFAAAFGGALPGVPGAPAAAPEPVAPVREEPKPLKPGEYRIGTLVPDFTLRDLTGRELKLSAFRHGEPLVLALVSPSCPVSKRYLPTLTALQQSGTPLLLLSNATAEEEPVLAKALATAGLTAPCLRDPGHAVAAALGATASTDAFLLDRAQTLVYRGAIDDQYGLGYSRDSARRHYLTDAMAAIAAGHAPLVPATEAPGCLLDLGTAKAADATAPTYHNRVSRLLQSHCQECHRTGGVAPFPLETYEQVIAKAGMIRKMVDRRLMPPWFAAAPGAGEHSPWQNDRSLTEEERGDLLAWLEAGKPLGEPAQAVAGRQWPGEWEISTPDAVFQIPKPLAVNATGTMPYIHQTVETGLTEDKWVRGFEVLPTARDVVHHVLVFVQPKGGGGLRDFGNFLAAYVPGNNSVIYPEGFAKQLPAGSKLIFQIHYTPNGTATQDQVRIGLLYGKEAPEHVVRVAEIANHRLNIPPHEDNHPEIGTIPVPRPVMVLGLMPHMHLRGKAFRYEATLPDGTKQTLLDVPRYDFNWQLAYRFAQPPILPAGTTVQATGWFDNSEANPANPNPGVTVKWGPQTTDEMMLGYVEYCLVGEAPPKISQR